MHKNTLWCIVVVLVLYLTLVFCEDTINGDEKVLNSEARDVIEDERRIRRRHGFHHLWGWSALAVAYWIKVKLVIVSVIFGSAVFLGLRYFWPHKCGAEISGPVYLDHPPSFSHHDHIPYALDHSDDIKHSYDTSSYDVSSYEPYSSYLPPTSNEGPPPTSSGRSMESSRKTRSVAEEPRQKRRPEEQIAEFMFLMLGVDSTACRRRFICEMEFRSQENPLTNMAFRIVGRGFFGKYTNARNAAGQANNFAECAAVNAGCVFIEQDDDNENPTEQPEEEAEAETVTDSVDISDSSQNTLKDSENEIANADENNDLETVNSNNLKAERRYSNFRARGDRTFKNIVNHLLFQRN